MRNWIGNTKKRNPEALEASHQFRFLENRINEHAETKNARDGDNAISEMDIRKYAHEPVFVGYPRKSSVSKHVVQGLPVLADDFGINEPRIPIDAVIEEQKPMDDKRYRCNDEIRHPRAIQAIKNRAGRRNDFGVEMSHKTLTREATRRTLQPPEQQINTKKHSTRVKDIDLRAA